MHRLALLSCGLLFAVLLGCNDPSGPSADSYSAETSAALSFGGAPSISLEKSTNGQDADAQPGPSITPGDLVVWEYRVTNTGDEELNTVYVIDDMEGFICGIATLAVGAEAVCQEKAAPLWPFSHRPSLIP